MSEPKSGFEAWLRGAMADMRQQWEIMAYGRPVTGELVAPFSPEKATEALESKERSGSGIEAPEIGLPEKKQSPYEVFHEKPDSGFDKMDARQREHFEQMKAEMQREAKGMPSMDQSPNRTIDR